MLRWLAIVGISITLLFGRPSVAENQQSASHTARNEANQRKRVIPPTHVVIDPPLPASDRQPESAQPQSNPPEKPLPRFLRPEWVIVYVTVVYAIVAWLTLGAIKKQANLLERQILSAEDTTQKQLRAYVYIDSAALKFPEPGIPEAQVHFKNCGQTPAHDVRGWIHTWFACHPLTEVLPIPPSAFITAVEPMAPGRISVFVAPRKPPIEEHKRQWLGTPIFTMYVYGEVTYKDTFGIERVTKYRLIYGGHEGTRKSPRKDEAGADIWILNPDTSGNEAT